MSIHKWFVDALENEKIKKVRVATVQGTVAGPINEVTKDYVALGINSAIADEYNVPFIGILGWCVVDVEAEAKIKALHKVEEKENEN